MSYSFYFLLGQTITLLGINWPFTFLINLIILAISMIFHHQRFMLEPIGLIIGWFSTVLTPAFFLKHQTQTFFINIATQLLLIFYALEIILFTVITSPIFFEDSETDYWIITCFFHLFYILFIIKCNEYSSRISRYNHEQIDYFIFFGVTLLTSDASFLFGSIILEHSTSTLSSIVVVGIISFLTNLFLYLFMKDRNIEKNEPIIV